MRFAVEPWAPEYGSAFAPQAPAGPPPAVDLTVEVPPARWAPIAPPPDAVVATDVLFVDGVRRVDAQVWIEGDDGLVRPGLCASYAAGCVRSTAGRARLEEARVERGLFVAGAAEAILTPWGPYAPRVVAGGELDQLVGALQQRLGALEIEAAEATAAAGLVVLDGPLSGRTHVRGAVGYIKTHRVAYLRPEVAGVVARLAPGERTPLFVTQTSWSRYSWYLRLAASGGHPWAGVVRCEASADLALDEARRRAELVAATLPRFASAPHKDPRAPQNLYPIGGLERDLRHRLGDAGLLYRALSRVAGLR